jgi:AcrR family transcriptional regulator
MTMLDRAASVFARYGYVDSHVDALSARLGLSKPRLYALFGSKQKLYTAVVRHERAIFEAAVVNSICRARPQTLWALAARVLASVWRLQTSRPQTLRVLFGTTDWRVLQEEKRGVLDRIEEVLFAQVANCDHTGCLAGRSGDATAVTREILSLALVTSELLATGRASRQGLRSLVGHLCVSKSANGPT